MLNEGCEKGGGEGGEKKKKKERNERKEERTKRIHDEGEKKKERKKKSWIREKWRMKGRERGGEGKEPTKGKWGKEQVKEEEEKSSKWKKFTKLIFKLGGKPFLLKEEDRKIENYLKRKFSEKRRKESGEGERCRKVGEESLEKKKSFREKEYDKREITIFLFFLKGEEVYEEVGW
jgi:hypothetical protein